MFPEASQPSPEEIWDFGGSILEFSLDSCEGDVFTSNFCSIAEVKPFMVIVPKIADSVSSRMLWSIWFLNYPSCYQRGGGLGWWPAPGSQVL